MKGKALALSEERCNGRLGLILGLAAIARCGALKGLRIGVTVVFGTLLLR